MNTLDEIVEEWDSSCSMDSNYQHLRHMFEGYRERLVEMENYENPYSPDGARWHSFEKGSRMAVKDIRIILKNNKE